ncbi:MAG: penicillin-binding transpeptidase domain-containing protein [Christensenellales bacterium]
MLEKFNLKFFKKRIVIFTIILIILFCAILGRLLYVQVFNGGILQGKATDQWTRDLPIAAERGTICDTNGSSLAVSYTTYDIYVRSREVKDKTAVSSYLSSKLNLDQTQTFEKVSNNTVSEVLIKMKVDKSTALEIFNQNFSGVYLSENVSRYYPYGNLMTQILGFTTIDNIGQAGLEAYYNELLSGVKGYSLVQSDLQGKELYNSLTTFIPSVAGCSINMTIDVNIQLKVEQTLEKLMVEQKAKSATAIVMDPNTGEILAMSTKPSFDLNNIPRDDVSNMLQQMKNQAIVDVYEPGSTFKILTMACALESQVAHLSDHFYCPGYTIIDGQKIKCWKSTGHGSEDLTDGLCNSCNCVFTKLALQLGLDDFYQYFEKFGLGTQTGIEFLGESSGIIMNKDNVKTVDLARMGFGQAIAVTPLQLITAISACVNGGYLLEPYLVKSIVTSDGTVVKENEKTVVRQVISNETSEIINSMLEEVVSKPGKLTFVDGYEIGGKTGTSQKYEDGKISGKYVSSFIGTYPASNPEYIVLIVVDEPGTGAYYGSVVASPYAKEIFSGIFEYKNISKSGEEYITPVCDITLPNLVGMSITEACTTLKKLGLCYEIQGDGSFVTRQLPPPGTLVYKNQSIYLITDTS